MDTKELELANEAGFLKTPEQQELVEQQSFEEGYQACIKEAHAGLLNEEGVYNAFQISEYLGMYKEAIREAINDLKGTYLIGSGHTDHKRLFNQLIEKADEKFGNLIPQDQDGE